MGKRTELPIHSFINQRWDEIKRTGISGIHNKKDEIISQAWLIAQEIQDMRGRLVDFSSPNDQKLILKGLKQHFLNSAEWHRRRAISLDHWVNEEGYDEGAHPVLIRLSKERSTDPVVILESIEESVPEPGELKFDYSQASAYVDLLNQCDKNLEVMARYLSISTDGCRIRCAKAESVARLQWPIPISPLFHFIPNPWGIRPGLPVQFFLAFETQLNFDFISISSTSEGKSNEFM